MTCPRFTPVWLVYAIAMATGCPSYSRMADIEASEEHLDN